MLHGAEFVDQLSDRFEAIGDHAQRADFPSCFRHSYGDCIGVDIETNKA